MFEQAGRRAAGLGALAAGAGIGAALVVVVRERRRRARGPVVRELLVYPLKSGAEVSVDRATAGLLGFEGDRLLQVTDGNGKFVTPRDSIGASALHPGAAELFRVRCEPGPGPSTFTLSKPDLEPLPVALGAAGAPEVEAKVLGVPRPNDNKELLVDLGDAAARWLERALRAPGYRLHGVGPRYRRVVVANPGQGDAPATPDAPLSLADEAPYLLTSTASLDDLRSRLRWSGYVRTARSVDMRRYRPNIVVDGLLPWEEDTWKVVKIGQVKFQVWQRCARCLMTTFCRDCLQRDAALGFLRTFRERLGPTGKAASNFGMHLIPIEGCPAQIALGDSVEVLERDPERVQEWLRQHGPPSMAGLRFALGLPGASVVVSLLRLGAELLRGGRGQASACTCV